MKRAIVIIVVLAAGGALGWWLLNRSRPAPAPEETATATVRRGDIELLVEATGSIESNQDVEIKSKASGEVMKLPYDVSDRVPKYVEGSNEGKALLVQLDAVDELRVVQRAKAQADAAEARLGLANHGIAECVSVRCGGCKGRPGQSAAAWSAATSWPGTPSACGHGPPLQDARRSCRRTDAVSYG